MRDVGKRSTGFADEARTRTSTPSSGTAGLAISLTANPATGPGLSQTIAFIFSAG
jgi:hypothetical protein